MSITMMLRLFVMLFGSLLIVSGFSDLGMIQLTGLEWLSIGGTGIFKVVVGLFMLVLAISPNSVNATLQLIFKKGGD